GNGAMHVRTIVGIAAGLTLLIGGTFALLRLLQGRELAPNQGIAGPPTETVASVSDQQPESSHSEIILPPKLPETAPPADVPITEANRRDAFPVIREPWYVSAQEGDNLL